MEAYEHLVDLAADAIDATLDRPGGSILDARVLAAAAVAAIVPAHRDTVDRLTTERDRWEDRAHQAGWAATQTAREWDRTHRRLDEEIERQAVILLTSLGEVGRLQAMRNRILNLAYRLHTDGDDPGDGVARLAAREIRAAVDGPAPTGPVVVCGSTSQQADLAAAAGLYEDVEVLWPKTSDRPPAELDAEWLAAIERASLVVVVRKRHGGLGPQTTQELAHALDHGRLVHLWAPPLSLEESGTSPATPASSSTGPAPYPVELFEGNCPCKACVPADANPRSFIAQVSLCPNCGNQRCPGAADHRRQCSGSNEPGQPGSLYEHAGVIRPASPVPTSAAPQLGREVDGPSRVGEPAPAEGVGP